MKMAVILNSGTGSRMGELTKTQPKCLVEITGTETIISRQVKSLQEAGIDKILITTGPFSEMLEAYLKRHFEKVNFSFVHNPRYEETNYIYSLLLAADNILGALGAGDQLILLHGDLVYDRAVSEKLLKTPFSDAVLTNPQVSLPEKDFKAEIKGGRVKKIGVEVFGEACVFLIPFYKLTRKSFAAWVDQMKNFEKEGRLKVYAEDALNNILNELVLHPVPLRNEFCTEIDDEEDLAKVKRYLHSET